MALCFDAAVEIERKFLVPEHPRGLEGSPATRIEQGYIAIASDGTEVRVRRRDGRCVLTVKIAIGGVTEDEASVVRHLSPDRRRDRRPAHPRRVALREVHITNDPIAMLRQQREERPRRQRAHHHRRIEQTNLR